MSIRTFSLKDPEAYAILCGDREYSELPSTRWTHKGSEVSVRAANRYEALTAFEEWQRHVDAGRIGLGTERSDAGA